MRLRPTTRLQLVCSGVLIRTETGWALASFQGPAKEGTAAQLLYWWQEAALLNHDRDVGVGIWVDGFRVEAVWTLVKNRYSLEMLPGWRRLFTPDDAIEVLRLLLRRKIANSRKEVRVQVYDPHYVVPTAAFPRPKRARRLR